MTKRFELKAEYLDKWIAQLRSPNAEKVTSFYLDRGMSETDKQYVDRVTACNQPVCGCALGQFAAVNPEAAFDDMGIIYFAKHRSIPNEVREQVIRMNDWQDKTFLEIADWLEANVERV